MAAGASCAWVLPLLGSVLLGPRQNEDVPRALLLTAHSSDVTSGVLSPGTALPTRSSSTKVMMVS